MNKNVFNHRIKQILWSVRFCAIVLCWFWWNPGSGFEPCKWYNHPKKEPRNSRHAWTSKYYLFLFDLRVYLCYCKKVTCSHRFIFLNHTFAAFFTPGSPFRENHARVGLQTKGFRNDGNPYQFCLSLLKTEVFFTTQPLATYSWRISKKAVPRTTLDDYVYLFELFRSRDTV